METPSSAAGDVGFGLETLTRFYADAGRRTREALSELGGDKLKLDVPNLAASLVPPYRDEVMALGHLMIGRPVDESEARQIVYEAAFGSVTSELER